MRVMLNNGIIDAKMRATTPDSETSRTGLQIPSGGVKLEFGNPSMQRHKKRGLLVAFSTFKA